MYLNFIPISVVHYPPQWECGLCEKRYSSRQPLGAHLKKVHGVTEQKFLKQVGTDDAADLAQLKGLY